MSELGYLARSLEGLKREFDKKRCEGAFKGGERNFRAAALRAVILHQLAIVDLTTDPPSKVFKSVNASFEESTAGPPPAALIAKSDVSKGKGYQHSDQPSLMEALEANPPSLEACT